MNNIQKKSFLLLCEFHDFCIHNDIEYCLCGESAFAAAKLHELSEGHSLMEVIMTSKNFQLFQDKFYKSEMENRELESLITNGKFPYLSAHYVDTETLMLDSGKVSRVKCPGISLIIYRLIPCPQGRLKRKWFFIKKESLAAAVLRKPFSYSGSLKRRILNGIMRTIRVSCFATGGRLASILYRCGERESTGDCEEFYLEDNSIKRVKIPAEIFCEYSLETLEGRQFFVPKNIDEYLSYVYSNSRVSLYRPDDQANHMIVSHKISYRQYLMKIPGIIDVHKFHRCRYMIALSERLQKKNRKIINKARHQYARTTAYYKLEDSYSTLADSLKILWEQKDYAALDQELTTYINVVWKNRKVNLPIGYDKELYDLVIKYLALTEAFSLCTFMIKKRREAFRYIDRMTEIKCREENQNGR